MPNIGRTFFSFLLTEARHVGPYGLVTTRSRSDGACPAFDDVLERGLTGRCATKTVFVTGATACNACHANRQMPSG